MSNKLNKNSLNFLAKEAVSNLTCDISGVCQYGAELIAERFIKSGFSDFYIVEGYVDVPGWTGRTSHAWVELYDTTIIDPTFSQFPHGTQRLENVYKKHNPKKYLQEVKKKSIKSDIKKYSHPITEVLKEFISDLTEVDQKPPKNDKKPPTGGDSEKIPPAKNDMVDEPPTDGGDAPQGGASDIFGGDEMSPGDGPPEGGGDEKSKISNYNEKLKSAKIVKFQKTEPEPGYKFEPDDKFYIDNYVGKTKNNSMILAVPRIDKSGGEQDYEKNLNFIKSFVIPKINNSIQNALKQKKRVVLMGNHGVPSVKGEYTDDEQGIIAKYLNEKYKGGYIIFDTWAPKEYYAFVSNDELWQQVKERTEAENLEIKSALYLYLLTTLHGRKFAGKLKTENVLKTIESWGVSKNDVEKFTTEGLNKISAVIYPEISDNAETLASFIIKTYLQLLRVNMMKKVLKYEKEGKVVIVISDENTAWSLKPSFDKADEIISAQKEEPSTEPEKSSDAGGGEEPPPEAEKPAKEKQPPEEK